MLKVKIDYKSFFRRGLKDRHEDFEVALIVGYMGSGKTYFGVYKTEETNRDVFTNVRSYETNTRDVSYFTYKEELYNNTEPNKLFLVDECSKWFPKDCKIDKAFYEWLQHSRKCNRYVYLIFQEYLMVPNWIRGVATRVYTTKKIPFLPVHVTTYGVPVLDTTTCEWGVQELLLVIYKRNKKIADKYDTTETIL